MGRKGAVVLLEGAGAGWRAGSYGQQQQVVSTAGQEGGAGRPWASWVGAGRRGPDKPTSVPSEEERTWSWRGLSVQPSLPLSRRTSQRLTSGSSSFPGRIMVGSGLELLGSALGSSQWEDWDGKHSALFLRWRRADYDLPVWPYILTRPCHLVGEMENQSSEGGRDTFWLQDLKSGS